MHLTVCSCYVTYTFLSKSTLHSCLNDKELLAWIRREIWRLSDCNWTRPRTTYFLNEHSTISPNWPTNWAIFWVLIYTGHLRHLCCCHLTYMFQTESMLYICLNLKELLARSRREIQRLRDWNWTRSQNNLVLKRTLNHFPKLAKWLNCVVNTYLYHAFDCLFLSYHVNVSEWTTLYSCLNIKKLLAQSKREVWR